jgi:hypothetical protein
MHPRVASRVASQYDSEERLDMEILRPPEERFKNLPGFAHAPLSKLLFDRQS